MQSARLVERLKAYQSLTADQQTVMKLLALYYGYSSPTNLAKCLAALGIKEAGKALKSDVVKSRLKPLLKLGLIDENAKSGGSRCCRTLVEVIARQMVDAGEFKRYASAVLAANPPGIGYYRYGSVEDCIRDARLQFYRGDYRKVDECLESGERYLGKLPPANELYLSWFLNPLDSAWFSKNHPQLLVGLAAYAGMHQLLYLYADPKLDELLASLMFADNGEGLGFLNRIGLELQLLRGDWETVATRTCGAADPELQALAAALAFLRGDYAEAVKLYDAALAAQRKLAGQRNAYFYGLAGVFYPLAILKHNDAKQRAKLGTLLNQAIKGDGYWIGVYHDLALFNRFLQGELQLRSQLLAPEPPYKIGDGYRDSGLPETLHTPPLLLPLMSLLVKFWVKADHFQRVDPLTQKLYRHLQDNGYRWPAAELATVFKVIEPPRSKQWDSEFLQGRPALRDLFASRADWEVALDALANLPVADKKTASAPAVDKPTRLVWLLAYDEQGHRVRIEPREQKLQAKGGWSKGRAVALKRLAQETDQFDYLTEQDLKLCSHIKEYRDSGWYGGTTFFDFDSGMPQALIGHPLLFWADTPDAKVEVLKGDAELRVKKLDGGGKIKITLEPQPGYEQKFHVGKETPTRLRVIEFSAEHHKIHGVLGPNGLEAPASAQERVLQALTAISGVLTVHSDIGGSSANAEQVAADSTPRVHLLPLGEGLRVAVLIRPLADGGAYYRPGHGGESVLAELDGRPVQAVRDLALEKRRAADLLQACPVLSMAEQDAAGEYLLEQVEQCLELLLQLQGLNEGVAILEWPEGVKFKLLGQTVGTGLSVQVRRDNDWFSVQGELRVDDNTVVEIRQLLGLLDERQGRFLKLKDGQFFALTEEFRRRLEDLRAYADLSGKKVRLNPLAALTLEDWQDEAGFQADQHWQNQLQRLKDSRDYQPQLPSTFQAELRDYQTAGFRWLARLAHWGVGACLADDMGLGKTVQGLALLLARAPDGPSLIVAPTSVCMNWENEARRFAPTLNPQILAGGDRQGVIESLGPYDLLICSYGLLQQETVAEILAQIRFRTVILDEAQWIKNIATRRSQGAMNLQADFKMIMTGTPLENHLGELWNLFRFINPGLLGSLEQFNRQFAGPIERDANPEARYRLKKLIQPFILRRTKTQVLQELPPRTEIPVYVELSAEEMAFYEALRRQTLEALATAETPAGQKQLQILAAISKLRRSCCNTRLVNSGVALPSSKLAAFGDIVDELLENKHKALVFSQFVDHLQLIKEYVEQRGIAYQYLDGSTPAKERQQRVDAFQRGNGELFLISLKAGGVGLNLTAADYVIHMDPWWNPAVEDQASDRAHRMGQQRPVTIYRMIAKQTIEEKIVALHSHKRDLADSLLDGADVSGKVSADELLSLMKGDA
ncbi:DEAD/DEAH box helicase [Methylomonas koyamae]|uniref:DEAD/DEAH box helicase n=1 Tax=Methylomonas koyamae TaxID=702114 RepID=UPI00112BAB15|nr:DEAD/DEAH box helicase [Methylomonas koyamae]TPQ24447.1 ATP-dependent helicase [Methylomonas koyamae]